MDQPKRIQRRRVKGWRMPHGAVYVGRPTVWGSPYRVVRVGKVTWEVERFGRLIAAFTSRTGTEPRLYAVDRLALDLRRGRGPWSTDTIRNELAGLDLACWCPLDQPCHADILLTIANTQTQP